MSFAPPHWKLTVDEFERMGEVGIFQEDDRVELLDGELYEMTPIGDDHIGAVNDANLLFVRRLVDRAIVSPQNPIRLSDRSEPQPDLAILRPREDRYRRAKARPEDVLLVIEIARSSLEYDRLIKLPRYAAAGIVEVWIVNLVDERIEAYRDPAGGVYRTITIHLPGETLTPVALPDITVGVEEILG